MNSPPLVELFCEDIAHERALIAFLSRVAQEEEVEFRHQTRSARGGHARAIAEYRRYQQLLSGGAIGVGAPELIIVAIDANCNGYSKARRRIQSETLDEYQHLLVTACPDPHIERWYLADPDSFHHVVGYRPTPTHDKCRRHYYKDVLRKAIQAGGHPSTLGGVEFATELVEAMDLYRAGKMDRSLKAFLDDLRNRIRSLSRIPREQVNS